MINNNIIDNNFSWLNGRHLTVGFSGGKDSLATCLYLKENNIKFTPVFIDTGFEHEKTIDYIYNYCVPNIVPNLVTIRNEKYFDEKSEFAGGFEQLVADMKIFPSFKTRFCTRDLKVRPLLGYLNEIRIKTLKKPINVNGIRKQESKSRSKMSMIEEKDEATTYRPIINWSEQNVIDIIRKHDIKPNPLYISGASRVGCYPCIFARKHEIRYISIKEPERISYIEDFEDRINNLEHNKKKDRKSYFFTERRHVTPKKQIPIRDFVKWGNDKNYDDTIEQEEKGCMKWGLCESNQPHQLNLFDSK